MKADITVVMPVYNAEKTIAQAINSITSQDIPCEVIIADDMSTDGSCEAARRAANGFPQVELKIISTGKQSGPGAARNLAVREAEGKYIAFLDADDMWAEGKLKKQLDLLENSDAVMCSTAREFIDENGKHSGTVVGVQKEIGYKDLLKTNSISLSSVMIKRDVMLEFPFPEDRNIHEDYVCWLKILKKYGKCLGINKPLLYYRRSSSGQVSGGTVNTAKKHLRSLRAAGIGPVKSLFCFASYAVNGVIKYRGLK